SIAETRYVIALDSDTDLPRNAARRLVGTLSHPLNRAEIDPKTRIVSTGYGILQPRVETTWDSAGSTPFARLFSGHTGVDPYTTAVSNAYQDLFGEGIFIGKGIYEVDAFEETTRGRFPKDAILSHDLLEGVYARVGLVSDIELFEDFPSSYNAYAARSHRWVRGDWQIAGWLLPRVSSGPTTGGSGNSTGSGATERNTLTPINRWKIGDNLRRSLVAPASLLLLALAWLAPLLSPLFWTVSILLVYAFPFYSHLLTSVPSKPAGTLWSRHLSAVFEDAGVNLLQLLLILTFLAHTAYLMVDAVIRTLARMLITHRKLLEWVTAREAQRTLGRAPLDFVRRMWQAPAIAALITLASLLSELRPETMLIAAPFLAAWALSPIIAYLVSTPRAPVLYTMTEEERLYLRRVARKTWRFFEEFVGEKDRWLAPDNFQEYPKGGLAHRTSPTNLGLLLLSTLSAYDLGYITISEMVARTDRTLSSMEKLERYNGHFYNWYDTRSGQPLPPKYISSVDSGNLAGHLLALKNGCAELLRASIFSPQMAQHLRDLTQLLDGELGALRVEHRSPLQTTQRLTLDGIAALVEKIAVQARSTPQTMLEWAEWTNSLVQPTTDLATEARRLAGARGWEPDPKQVQSADVNNRRASSLEELVYWADSLARAVRSLEQELGSVVPWASMLAYPPALLVDEARPEIAAHWARLKTLQGVPSYSDILQWCAAATPEIRRLRARIRDGNVGMANSQTDAESETAAALRWLEMLSQRVSSAWAASELLLGRLTKAVNRVNSMAKDMKFGFLYDEERKLFSIGYNVAELRRDDSYYDLLASEARLGSYVAIASGEVEQSHWFGMARPTTGRGRKLALLSWTGTMFEYLMPNLVMPLYSGSLLDQTCAAAVRYQEQHGREHNLPWGFSEAAYNALDSSGNYKYRAFGLPELGIKRGLSEDLVVAPYATQLALSVAPRQALANMRRLSSFGLEGRYGFYDSIDFTRARRTSEESGAIVGTYMVHHLGMGLVATNNYLNNEPMVRRFQAEPEVRATLLLLQERVPRQASTAQPHPLEVKRERAERDDTPPVVRSYTTPNTDVARAHLISNGRYSVMITNSGAGYSRWGAGSSAMAVTRWRNDWVRDAYGSFIYISDTQSGAVWSAAAAPFGGEPAGYRAHFGLENAEFFRHERSNFGASGDGVGNIETHMEIVVSPEDDAEIRRVTLSNRGSRTRDIELTSYAEIALAAQSADEAHPAFSKLFIETEYFPGCGALLASRRPKAADEQR
ncbi:MAG: glucoamylase family protein, partial [Chloroflexota bacterium]